MVDVGISVLGSGAQPELFVARLFSVVAAVDHLRGDEVVGIAVDKQHGEGRFRKLVERGCFPEAPAVADLGHGAAHEEDDP